MAAASLFPFLLVFPRAEATTVVRGLAWYSVAPYLLILVFQQMSDGWPRGGRGRQRGVEQTPFGPATSGGDAIPDGGVRREPPNLLHPSSPAPTHVRVLHILGSLDHGGAERWLLDMLPALAQAGVHSDFLLHTPNKGAYEDEVRRLGARVHRVTDFSRPVSYARALRRILCAGTGPTTPSTATYTTSAACR